MEGEEETCQITQETLLVCVHMCALRWLCHAVSILSARKGKIFALPPGRKEEAFTKKQPQGCQGGFIRSFCRSLCTLVEGTFCSRGLASSPPCCLCPCACQAAPIPRWLLPGSAHKPPQPGPDWEARPLPALAAQGWPFPSNSTSPEWNVPRHLCLEPNCVQEPGFAHTC